jgi:hypothetical protein
VSFLDSAVRLTTYPLPLRTIIFRRLLRKIPIGSYKTRIHSYAVNRPHYGWCLYHASVEAKSLGYKAITAIEFGVAGGNGIVSLCEHKQEIARELGIEVVVVGFDSGTGLPETNDPRDLLYFWPARSFELDQNALKKRIGCRAELVLGNVADTIKDWQPRADAPIGAIMFDLDFYTSTMASFNIFTKPNVLPRVWCYFDDIRGDPENAYSDSIGEREAIKQFNLDTEREKENDHLSPAFTFKGLPLEAWQLDIYLYHRMNHPSYNACPTQGKMQLHLSA